MKKLTFWCLILFSVGYIAGNSLPIGFTEATHILSPISGKSYDMVSDKMPVIKSSLPPIKGSFPVEKRDYLNAYYLQCSIRIRVGAYSGSGTICHYDEATGEAYVISCGHLFEDENRKKEIMPPGGNTKYIAKIDVFYKNDEKLNKPQRFNADIICYDTQEDISFLKFKPDWVPHHHFAIAPVDYAISKFQVLESTGCDGGEETAAYTVKIVEGDSEGRDLVTADNSPRPGRSGGGLLSKDGHYLAIVWGTSVTDGTGYGYYVPLRRIHAYMARYSQISWLLSEGDHWSVINSIPIEKNGVIIKFPRGYIPMP